MKKGLEIKKYELIKDDFIILEDILEDNKLHKLYRIRALKDFSDIFAGNMGGYIESENNLSQEDNCWVHNDAKVFENAKVCGDAIICDNAKVYGNATICGNAWVCDNVKVYGNAKVCDNAVVLADAIVCGDDIITGNMAVCGNYFLETSQTL